MTTIKNKQTGDTLTGTVSQETLNYFAFRIAGTTCPTNAFSCLRSEWEILPPPLPTGIGSVVKTSLNVVFVRVRSDESDPWRAAELGTDSYPSGHILGYPPITILSEGVRP